LRTAFCQSKKIKTTPIILNGDDATCTDMGYTTYVANFRDSWNMTNPQQSIRIKDIPAKGHDYAPADSLGKNIYNYFLEDENGELTEYFT
jgi:hypothetical protein